MAHLEIRVRGRARELVPRTHQLAVVTAVDAIADRLAQLNRNGAVVLDGEIGDAAPRIQPPGGDDRTGGAGRDARLAAAAVGAGALIHRQGQVRQDLAEKEPRAPLARDEVGVLADPAEPGEARRAGTLAELASQRVQIKGGRARHGATTGVSIMTWWRCRTLCIPPRRCVPSMPMRSMSSGSQATRS